MEVTMKRLLFLILSFFFTTSSFAQSSNQELIIKFILDNNFLFRDSGSPLSRDFVINCIDTIDDRQFIIECDDILFKHYITFFKDNKNRKVILITKDGASVENRWVYVAEEKTLKDTTKELWPVIKPQTLSAILIKKTGDQKYTEEYIKSVAHSSYRIKHPNNQSSNIEVVSGIPDPSWNLKLGEIHWDGNKFIFQSK
jgi:hypothetical protein